MSDLNLNSTTPNSPLILSGIATITEFQLSIKYNLKSNSPRDWLVFDALNMHTHEGRLLHYPKIAWATWTASKMLVLKRTIPAIPINKDVEVTITPWARFLKSGDQLKGSIIVPIPVEEKNPYFPDAVSDKYFELHSATKLLIEVETCEVTSSLKIEELKGTQGLLRVTRNKLSSETLSTVVARCDCSLPKSIKVKVRTDDEYERL